MVIKTFRDGNRFIVSFEDLADVSEMDMIQEFLGGIVGHTVTKEKDALAEPVEPAEEPVPVIPDPVFTGPRYTGMTPEEVIIDGKLEGFMYLASVLKDGNFDNNLLDATKRAVNQYLSNRFKTCNPDEYAGKLTEGQMKTFMRQFKDVLPPDSDATVTQPDLLRKQISTAIMYFQKM